MSTIGNTYYWANIYVRVPDRERLLEIISLSNSWIRELTDRLITYYIMPRPEQRPIFRLRVATSSEELARHLEDLIINKIREARSVGLQVEEPYVNREENLRRFSSIQLSFLRKNTDLLFEIVEERFEETNYRERIETLLRPDFCCYHLLSIALCLTSFEEGVASLNYFLGFGTQRLGWQSIFA